MHYSDFQQRQLDQKSGEELDRQLARLHRDEPGAMLCERCNGTGFIAHAINPRCPECDGEGVTVKS